VADETVAGGIHSHNPLDVDLPDLGQLVVGQLLPAHVTLQPVAALDLKLLTDAAGGHLLTPGRRRLDVEGRLLLDGVGDPLHPAADPILDQEVGREPDGLARPAVRGMAHLHLCRDAERVLQPQRELLLHVENRRVPLEIAKRRSLPVGERVDHAPADRDAARPPLGRHVVDVEPRLVVPTVALAPTLLLAGGHDRGRLRANPLRHADDTSRIAMGARITRDSSIAEMTLRSGSPPDPTGAQPRANAAERDHDGGSRMDIASKSIMV